MIALLGSIAAATSARGFNLLVSFQENPDNFRADFVASGLADAMIVIGTTSTVSYTHLTLPTICSV